MSQGKITKSLARRAVVSWREQPSQGDIEALRTNIERVGLVIRVRWVIVGALTLFSVVAGLVYGVSMDLAVLARNMLVPAIALVFVLAYNTFYQMTYRRLGNIAYLNQAQLLFDIFVATVLVYYSGGVVSWFSSMYLLFILEGAFILPERRHVWALVGASAVLVGIVFFGGYQGWLPSVDLPFVDASLGKNLPYVAVRYLWEITMYIGAGLAGMLMMRSIRQREKELSESAVTDELTGLFNSHYFQQALSVECARARSARASLALLLIDVDRLGDVNRAFGVQTGDKLLTQIGHLVQDAAQPAESVEPPGIACRVGGEEFAIIVTGHETSDPQHVPVGGRAALIAEDLRLSVSAMRVDDVGVTVSIGVAVWPCDGATAADLLDAADMALGHATASGGNKVCTADFARGAALEAPETGLNVED